MTRQNPVRETSGLAETPPDEACLVSSRAYLLVMKSTYTAIVKQRGEWWVAHRKSLTGVQKPKPLGSSHIDKTVKIEFADRTP